MAVVDDEPLVFVHILLVNKIRLHHPFEETDFSRIVQNESEREIHINESVPWAREDRLQYKLGSLFLSFCSTISYYLIFMKNIFSLHVE